MTNALSRRRRQRRRAASKGTRETHESHPMHSLRAGVKDAARRPKELVKLTKIASKTSRGFLRHLPMELVELVGTNSWKIDYLMKLVVTRGSNSL